VKKPGGVLVLYFLSPFLVFQWPLFRIPSLPLSSNCDTCNDLWVFEWYAILVAATYGYQKKKNTLLKVYLYIYIYIMGEA
jgi:hypothetical protein